MHIKSTFKTSFIFLIIALNISCNSKFEKKFTPQIIYKTEDLIITKLTENTFQHTSFLKTDDFGNVACNGLIVKDNNETIIFDTPTHDESAKELIKWIKNELKSDINAVISTHFHNDCLGGLQAFHNANIPSYANKKTIELATIENTIIPQNSFENELILKVGDKETITKFFGEGHTKDNVIGYFPSENVMFGGCLIKEIDASKGYLGDSNEQEWSKTIQHVKDFYPDVEIIIPGHGKFGDKKLLDYTINLFKTN